MLISRLATKTMTMWEHSPEVSANFKRLQYNKSVWNLPMLSHHRINLSESIICFNILACSKSGSGFALAWVGTGFRRLDSINRKFRSRVCRSSFFPDGSNMKENLTLQGFLLFCKNLINLSFLFFVVCNTWSFHHNLN